jgi:hypothetical protein
MKKDKTTGSYIFICDNKVSFVVDSDVIRVDIDYTRELYGICTEFGLNDLISRYINEEFDSIVGTEGFNIHPSERLQEPRMQQRQKPGISVIQISTQKAQSELNDNVIEVLEQLILTLDQFNTELSIAQERILKLEAESLAYKSVFYRHLRSDIENIILLAASPTFDPKKGY